MGLRTKPGGRLVRALRMRRDMKVYYLRRSLFMKTLVITLFALTLLCAGGAQARSVKEMSEVIKKPIEIEASGSKRMNVMFPHTAHKGISCFHCHHEEGSDGRYVACTECHATPGARERDPMSMFMAFHSKNGDRSCLGCHKKLAAENPGKFPQFKGCRPCHMSPAAREAAAAEKTAKP